MTSVPRPAQAPPGLTVGGYTLLTRLGEGGMGVVHLAARPGGPRVALKVIRPHIVGDDEARARLAREVGSLGRIRSTHVAEIVDADPWGEIPYVATRYVPGLSLYDEVREEGPIRGRDLRWLALCLAEALGAVHSCGVLHRDVKPSNVLMEGRSPVLIDFGLARVADDPRLTHTGWLLGTPGYLAPEILYGEDATTASDVHSWGATVAFAGLGRPPFGGGPALAIMDRVRRGEHDLTGLPAGVRELVEAAMDPEPARRPTVPQLLARLREEPVAPVTVAEPAPNLAEEDPFTVPLALAALARSHGDADGTEQLTAPPTQLPTQAPRVTTPLGAPSRPPLPPLPPRDPQSLGVPSYVAPTPVAASVRAPLGERLRAGILIVLGWAAAGTLTAAFPYLTVAALLVGAWLLRSGALAGAAARSRRAARGARWYDGLLVLASAPFHLLQSAGGTAMLLLWALGLAAAGLLLGYAAAASMTVLLLIAGTLLAIALWVGPGSGKVRASAHGLLHRVSARFLPWLVFTALAAAVATGGWAIATDHGTAWTPADGAPFSARLDPR